MKTALSFIFIFSVSLFSCGIDTVPTFIGKPVAVESLSTAKLVFSSTALVIPEYQGIDIFYRIYANNSDAEADRIKISERISSQSLPGSGSLVKSFLLSTTSSGVSYWRLYREKYGKNPPTINSQNQNELFELFVNDDEIYLKAGTDPLDDPMSDQEKQNYGLVRNILSGDFSFSSEPAEGDRDFVKAKDEDENERQYFVEFYAASYAVDFLFSNDPEIYSDPVYLGGLELLYN